MSTSCTTNHLAPSHGAARQLPSFAVNWWSWYVRLVHPKTRLEAISSRPKLLNAVGSMTSHAGHKRIRLTITQEAVDQIKRLVANVRAGLSHVLKNAPQLDKTQRWYALVQYIVVRILASNPRTAPPALAFATG